jgi:hypothetical protein
MCNYITFINIHKMISFLYAIKNLFFNEDSQEKQEVSPQKDPMVMEHCQLCGEIMETSLITEHVINKCVLNGNFPSMGNKTQYKGKLLRDIIMQNSGGEIEDYVSVPSMFVSVPSILSLSEGRKGREGESKGKQGPKTKGKVPLSRRGKLSDVL